LNFSQRGTFVNSITILGLGQHAIYFTSSTHPFEFVYIENSFLFLFVKLEVNQLIFRFHTQKENVFQLDPQWSQDSQKSKCIIQNKQMAQLHKRISLPPPPPI